MMAEAYAYMPVILQDMAAGTRRGLEAIETPEGLLIHEVWPGDPVVEDEDSCDDTACIFRGRLPLEAWRTLVEMYALRYPRAFAGVVAKWHALQAERPS